MNQHPQDPQDPVLDFDNVLSLARRHLPSARAVTAVDESGGEARAYVIDEVYIFKTQRPQKVRPRTSLLKAKFHQERLAELAPEVSVPRVLGYGREGSVEYVLESRIPGVAFRTLSIQGEPRKAVLRDLGETIRRIHSPPLAPFEESGLFPGDRTGADLAVRLRTLLNAAIDAIGAELGGWTLTDSPRELADRLIESVPAESERVALHSNPGPEHTFVDPDTLKFTGVIDFGDAYISHPAFDMRRWTTPDDRTAFLSGYTLAGPVSDGFMAVWHAVLSASVMTVFALRPERRAQAIEDLRRLLAEA